MSAVQQALIGISGTPKEWNVVGSQLWDTYSPSLDLNRIDMKPDGSGLYTGATSQLSQYNMTSNNDLNTVSFVNTYTVLAGNTGAGFRISPDGTKLVALERVSGIAYIRIYNLSTAYDLSTASFSSQSGALGTNVPSDTEGGIYIDSTGTRLYLMGGAGSGYTDCVRQYSMSTAWNAGSLNYSNKVISLVSLETPGFNIHRDVYFTPDGLKMFTLSAGLNRVYIWSLATAWDLATASYTNTFKTLEYGSPYSFTFSQDGLNMYITDFSSSPDLIAQYKM